MKRDLREIHNGDTVKFKIRDTERMIKDAGRSEGNTGNSGGEEHAGKLREDIGIIMEIKIVSEEIGGDLEKIQEEPKETIAILHGRFEGIQGDSREKQGIPGQMKREPREVHNGDTVKFEIKDTGKMIKDTGRSEGNKEKSRGSNMQENSGKIQG
jgi:hypothetical protein